MLNHFMGNSRNESWLFPVLMVKYVGYILHVSSPLPPSRVISYQVWQWLILLTFMYFYLDTTLCLSVCVIFQVTWDFTVLKQACWFLHRLFLFLSLCFGVLEISVVMLLLFTHYPKLIIINMVYYKFLSTIFHILLPK